MKSRIAWILVRYVFNPRRGQMTAKRYHSGTDIAYEQALNTILQL